MTGPAITVALLGPADAAQLDAVDDDVFDFPLQAALVRRFLAEPQNLLAVAVLDGSVVGMASAIEYVHPDKPLQLFINEVGVAARCRRRGVASRLVRCLLDEARRRGCTEAWVATEADNAQARALYAALQGREDPVPAIVYTFPLAAAGGDDGGGAA